MRHLLVSVALAAIIQIPAASQNETVDGSDAALSSYPCPPRPESDPASSRPPDVSPQGLVFDPGAPGGARPEERRESMPVPVDPRTVTLFPVPQQPSTTEPERRETDETIPENCRL